MLNRRRLPAAEATTGIVIALHGGDGGMDDLVPVAQSLNPGLEVVAVEAPRRVHDPTWTRRAYTWFDIQEPGRPEPVTFGDSLFQVEQLVYEVSETQRGKNQSLYLVGYDQGALLALALSLVLPDYLSGVVSVCGCLPRLAVWPLPDTNLRDLPILLIFDGDDPELPVGLAMATEVELRKRGGVPSLRQVSDARKLAPLVATTAREWLGM